MGESRFPELSVLDAMVGVAIVTFGLWILVYNLGLEALSDTIFVLGFLMLLPSLYVFGERFPFVVSEDETDSTEPEQGPMATLQEQYANGMIDEDEFERRAEKLLETEQLEAVYGQGNTQAQSSEKRGETQHHSSETRRGTQEQSSEKMR